MSDIETISHGSPLEFAIKGVKEIPSRDRRSSNGLATPIVEQYGISVDDDTANVIKRLYASVDGTALIETARDLGLDEADNFDELLAGFDFDEGEKLGLGDVLDCLDEKLTYGLASREKDVEKVSKKKQRETVYVPELVNDVGEGGTVFMAKSLSTIDKVKMAWDLHDENQVVVVDDYDKWENLLGWKKLKKLPHGRNKIREVLGDKLSKEVLEDVAGKKSDTDSNSTDDDTGSRGRRTRTKPTDEVLNVAIGSRHRERFKRESEEIKDSFEDDGYIGSKYKQIKQLILFPTTTEHNLSDHWWVAGNRWDGGGYAAIANCNKGTFEYLNDCDNVWHIEDYIDQADDYEFATNYGPVTLGTIDRSNMVLHLVEESMKSRFLRNVVLDSLPEVLPEYADDNMYNSPEFPHSDDMLYAPISMEDVFWMRPELIDMTDSSGGIILYSSDSPRNVGEKYNLSSDYKLYSRARLPEWDFDCEELRALDGASYSLDLEGGAYELVETLAKLHDAGADPFSETPEARWTQ